jgi:uncharacterized protein with beta-barrel porin domain
VGGSGSSGGGASGAGGAGGVGLYLNSATVTIDTLVKVTGGNGGTGGMLGAGGAGIAGSGLTIINNGAISGGFSADELTRADAIIFTGGTNFLGGTGTVGSVTMPSGSTFAPGSGAPGTTMTVAGNLAFQSGALYLVQVSPASASSANVTGTASLAGTVRALFASGTLTRSYTILSAAGGFGGTTFGALTTGNLPAGFTAWLSYTASDVILNVKAALDPLSANQANVANTLNAFFNSGGALPPNFLAVFGLTGSDLANALTLLSGEGAAGAQQGAFQLGNQFLSLMLDPFVDGRRGQPERETGPEEIATACLKATKSLADKAARIYHEPCWSVWGGGYGAYNKTSGDPANVGSHDLVSRTAGYAAGLDYHLRSDTVVGFALAGGGTNWSLAEGLGGGRSDAFQAGIYATTHSGPAYLAASLAFSNYWMSTDRFAAFGDRLTSGFTAQSFGGRAETGYRIGAATTGITPYAAVQAQNFRTPAYREIDQNGVGFALAYNSRTATDTRSELGARFDQVAAFNRNMLLTLRARIAWAHDWVSDPFLTATFQALPGASFVVTGAAPPKNTALTSAGAELRLTSGISIIGKFEGEFASRAQTYGGSGIVRYVW